jgi:hypothetical protein
MLVISTKSTQKHAKIATKCCNINTINVTAAQKPMQIQNKLYLYFSLLIIADTQNTNHSKLHYTKPLKLKITQNKTPQKLQNEVQIAMFSIIIRN